MNRTERREREREIERVRKVWMKKKKGNYWEFENM